MRTEDSIPLAERYLLVHGLVADAVYRQVKNGLPIQRGKATACCFVGFSYADLPFGTSFDCVCRRGDYRDAQRTRGVIIAATQQFGRPFDCLPHGWKAICLIDFPDGVPELVQHLPIIEDWYDSSPGREIMLCSAATWAAIIGP